jgi:hypothetical protein
VSERTFDRRIEFDERSRAYPIRALLEPKPLRGYTWGCPVRLDQGKDGACVGYAWTHELAARPKAHYLANELLAFSVYREAQYLDPWPDTPPEEGTSILAGAKASVARRWIGEYRWCFNVHDLALAVGYTGPVVLGLNWRSNMMQTDGSGYIHASGPVVGGHAILCNGYSVKYKRFKLVNSWGADWGMGGACYVSETDMASLLADDGEACIPVTRYFLDEWRL